MVFGRGSSLIDALAHGIGLAVAAYSPIFFRWQIICYLLGRRRADVRPLFVVDKPSSAH